MPTSSTPHDPTSSSGLSDPQSDRSSGKNIGAFGTSSYVLVLVHGTWGRKSPFIDAGGRVQTALKERFPGAVFSVFSWSGKNRVRDRLEAAAELGRHLIELHEEQPGARLVVAAHSHGGNVALYALKDPGVDKIVSGVVCFATPFINVSKRLEMRDDVYLIALPLVISAPLVALLAAGAYRLYFWWFW